MTRSNDPTYPLFPILSCIGFFLSIIPLPWHIQAWNSGTCAFMLWTAAFCLVKFVNSVVWAGNVNNVAPVWCDISTQIMMGATIGVPASTLCISRRLYKIAAIRTVSITHADKLRAVLEDVGIALGIPIAVLIMHIPVHAHRFDIFEDIGCMPVTYNTLAAYFLFWMWPIILGVISLGYSVMNLRTFYMRRAQFSSLVATTSAMNTSRYLRLMVLAVVDIMFTVPLGIYVVYIGSAGVPLEPWISWDDTHFMWTRVQLVPALFWRSNQTAVISSELNRWLAVFCAFLFFALFGFASEAQKNYRLAFWWIAKKFGFHPSPQRKEVKVPLPKCKPIAVGDSLPVYISSTTDLAPAPLKLQDLEMKILPDTPTTPSAPPSYESDCASPQSATAFSDSRYSVLTSSRPSSVSESIIATSPSSRWSRVLSQRDSITSFIHETRAHDTTATRAPACSSSDTISEPLATHFHLPLLPPQVYPNVRSHGGSGNLQVSSAETPTTNPFNVL
ncbi:a-factor receptor [Paramarasmius palmivorus]|uniref:A-factor receptor n=1 Tax=Paramarasmius palmivorus TaxID=297713 RepID=A0AAW0BLF0_9AGAR